MKKFTLIFIAFICATQVFSQKKLSFSDAINVADKQRTLIQRIAKNKLFIEVNAKIKGLENQITNDIREFELGIDILRNFAPTDVIKYKIDIQELTFKNYKRQVLLTTKTSMNEVISTNTLFLKICDDVFEGFSSYLKEDPKNNKKQYTLESIIQATNASGTFRYHTQRLALYHSIHFYDLKTIYPDEINSIVSKMEKSLNFLTVSEFNTLEIDDAISKVLYYWSDLKKKLYSNDEKGLSKIDPEELYKLTDRILEKSDIITRLYAELGE